MFVGIRGAMLCSEVLLFSVIFVGFLSFVFFCWAWSRLWCGFAPARATPKRCTHRLIERRHRAQSGGVGHQQQFSGADVVFFAVVGFASFHGQLRAGGRDGGRANCYAVLDDLMGTGLQPPGHLVEQWHRHDV